MWRNILSWMLAAIVLTACNQSKTETLSNQSNVIMYETAISVESARPDWVKNIDSYRMITNLFDKVQREELIAYSPYGDLNTPMKWEQILFQMDALNDTVETVDAESNVVNQIVVEGKLNLSEIQGIIFIEEWSQEVESGKIVKEVLGVAPVRYDNSAVGEEVRKSIVFVCYFTEKKPPLFPN